MAYASPTAGNSNNSNPFSGGLPGALGNLFGAGWLGMNDNFQNPANAGMPYFQQIPGATNQYFSPYTSAGSSAIPQLQGQYNSLLGMRSGLQGAYGAMMNNPAGVMNQIGSSFHQSPGYNFQVNQALGAANRSAAAGGMAGSPQEQQYIGSTVNDLANQDYYNYLSHGLSVFGQGLSGAQGMYNEGLSGEQGLYQGGEQAATSQAQMLAQALAAQGSMAYAGANGMNQYQQANNGAIGGLLGGAIGDAAFAFL